MDRLESMSVLLAVVESGSLSAASRRLGMPLATVSRRISDLEKHLKSRLFTRSSRHLALTDAGRSYVAACRGILEEVEEAERAVTGEYAEPRGKLVITAPIVFGRLHVLPVIAAFLKAYPEIDIRLVLADGIINLLEEHIDLAVRIGPLPDSSLIARRVGQVRRLVCGSPAYLAERGTPTQPEDLSAHDCVSFESASAPASWTFGIGRSEKAIAVHSRLAVNTSEAAIDAAIAGVGVTRVLSYQVAKAIAAQALVPVLEEFEPQPQAVSLVFVGQGQLPLKLRAFLDFAAPRLGAALQAHNSVT